MSEADRSRPRPGLAELAARLPPEFVLGTTSAAYAVEGALDGDGRGPSVWDTFAARPGAVLDGSDGSHAAEAYTHVEEDVELLAGIGGAHRFSVAWSRVQPSGRGAVNAAGLDHYDRLVDRLLAAGVRPMATLLHFDLPQGLADDGGWLNRETIDRFADYAAIVAERLADRVADWVPIEQPNVVMRMGYALGTHAPGWNLMLDALPVGHHQLVAHGRAAIALRAAGATSVGCSVNHAPIWPGSDDPADVGAAKIYDLLWNGYFLEGMLLGRYSPDLELLLEEIVHDGDHATMRQPLDFYGIVFDHPRRIAAGDDEESETFHHVPILGHDLTASGAPVVPEALREWLIMLRARLRAAVPPLVITGVVCAENSEPDAAGVVDDQARIDFHAAHLRAVAEAAQRGVDVRGYLVDSLLDGFAWTGGLAERTGLVHVDHATAVRTPKASYRWFADLLAAHRAAHPGAAPSGPADPSGAGA